jgi:tetratricopeptide (TPR) repeat protein
MRVAPRKILVMSFLLWLPWTATASEYASLLEQAQTKSRQAQWAEALPLWRKVTNLNPAFPDHWRQLGDAQYRLKDYKAAIASYEKALDLGAGFRANPAYNIACCYPLLGEKEAAYPWLEKALQRGYRNLVTPQTDEDLKSLRDDARFRELAGFASGIHARLATTEGRLLQDHGGCLLGAAWK